MQDRQRIPRIIIGGLVAGGLAGGGVGLGWYGPVVGVGLAVLVGLAVAALVYRARRA